MNNLSILIVGVGGQGTLLASRILGSYATSQGFDCKLSEVHGMSQRGGSVVTHIKIGDRVYSPIVEEGQADYVLAFEKLEGIRACHFLKKGGTMFVNNQEILPMPVITGQAKYPDNIVSEMEGLGKDIKLIDALTFAREAGSQRAVNTVLIGALLKAMGVELSVAKEAIKNVVKPSVLEINEKAIELGYKA